MVVGANHGGGGFGDRFAEDFARVREGRGRGAGGDLDAAQEAVLSVQTQHPEFLDGKPLGEGLQVGGDEVGAVEERGLAGLLADDAARDLHHGEKLEGFYTADALEFPVVGFSPGDQAGERSGVADEAAGEREDVAAFGAAAEQHREEFGIAEGGGAELLEPLLGTVADGGFSQTIAGGGFRLAGHANLLDSFLQTANLRVMNPLRVVVWGENVHEHTLPKVAALYPQGMHATIAAGLRERLPEAVVSTATLQEPEHGLSEGRLAETDVLTWWGHCAHDQVSDAVAERVQKRVLEGMGLIVLHSGHFSKVFKRLMGTTCSLSWRVADERERLWVCNPGHPIARGIDRFFELPAEEMYGEPFGVPAPEEQVFISWFEGGEVFRSGCCWRRGNGKIFYFRPGHETYPTYHDANVRRVIANAVEWARPEGARWVDACVNAKVAPEPIRPKISG